MITIFTMPKGFVGNIRTIQRNAILSWSKLQPACEIILLGNDEGTAEMAVELGVRHIPDVKRNQHGTPLINSLFAAAQQASSQSVMCYVNADIILMSDFASAIERVRNSGPFLMIGERHDLNLQEPWDFGQPDWEERLRDHTAHHCKPHGLTGLDYFAFPRGFWTDVPAFAIGRTAWDNWLVYRARAAGANVIDASPVVMAIHQNHDYGHVPNGDIMVWKGPEAIHNQELAGGADRSFGLTDATHLLTPEGLKIALTRKHLKRRAASLPVLYPRLGWAVRPAIRIYQLLKGPAG